MAADRSNVGALSVRRVHPSDFPAITKVHIAAFPDAAITALGAETVRRYYQWQTNPVHDGIGLVAERDGVVVGFCFGGVFRGAMSGFLRSNGLFLVAALALRPDRLLHKRFRARVWSGARLLGRIARRSFTRPGRAQAPNVAAAAAQESRSFGILVMATDPREQLRGVGRALMATAEAEARHAGFRRMNLSVHPSNERAVQFYETIGWHRVNCEPSWRGEMERRLDAGCSVIHGHPSGA